MKPIRKRLGRWSTGVAIVAMVAGLFGGVGASPASAAPSSNLVYSTDGGATWTTSPTVVEGEDVLVRAYYGNDTADALDGAQVSTSLPSGFSLVPGSTRVCLNPGTTDPTSPSTELVCNDSPGQGGAINEGAVWSGDTLTISPTAGVYGGPVGATSGVLATGTVRYLNLHHCVYLRQFETGGDFNHFTQVANTGSARSGTNASNVADTTLDCTTPNGFQLNGVSGVQPIDLLGNRYLNLHHCVYLRQFETGGNFNHFTQVANTGSARSGTNASNVADTTLDCTTPNGFQLNGVSGVQPIDLLDTARGQGFVEFAMTAPEVDEETPLDQGCSLTGPGTGDPSCTETVTVVNLTEIPLLGSWPLALGIAGVGGGGAWFLVHRRRRSAAAA